MKRSVVGIVEFEDKILLGKKIIKDDNFLSGKWHIPGGTVEEGETRKEALIRELKEETNLDISIVRKVCTHKLEINNAVVSWYLCSTDSDLAKAEDDLENVMFVDKKTVLEMCDERPKKLWPKEVIDYFNLV